MRVAWDGVCGREDDHEGSDGHKDTCDLRGNETVKEERKVMQTDTEAYTL